MLDDLLATGATVVASIWGRSVEDYARAADLLAEAPAGVVAVEVNLSCPNLEGRGSIFAHDAVLSAEVIAATAGCGRPRWAKLSANTDRIIQVAEAVVDAGAEAVTCINTLLGLAYDPDTLSADAGCRRRRAVGARHPSGRGSRRSRRAPGAARRPDRRRRRRRIRMGRGGADVGGRLGRAGRHGVVRRPSRDPTCPGGTRRMGAEQGIDQPRRTSPR